MHGAKGVLMNITYKGALPLYEISRASEIIEDVKCEDSNFIWGCIEDDTIENDVEVTLVAAGFDEGPDYHKAQAEPKEQPHGYEHAPERRTAPQYRTVRAPAAEPAPAEPQAEAQPETQRISPERHTPDWLREGDSSVEEKKTTDNKKPTNAARTSAYDAYERPAFSRMGRKLKMPH